MVSWAFSLAAAGLFPALVLGVWWKRANAAGAVAGMIAGFGLCIYYLVGTRYGAIGFYDMWSGLSAASPEAIAKYTELKAALASAAPDAQAAALAALDKHAQTMANWWGVKNLSSAAFGLPLGFAVMVIVSLMTKAPSQEMQNMIEEIRVPRGKQVMEEKTT
jgi:cation/acetate symporter